MKCFKTIFIYSSIIIPFSNIHSNNVNNKPNVILLFSDQHNANTFSFTGHPDVKTPNLDKLANNGISFNRAYCQDAISAPSRNSLFTGLYPRTLGMLDNDHYSTETMINATSLQKVFQQNGYKTYAFGKRHLLDSADKGWTMHKSSSENESPEDNYVKWIDEQGYADEFGQDWAAEFGKYPSGNKFENTKYEKAEMGTRNSKLKPLYTMEAFSAMNTIDMIKKHSKNGEPFFCFCSFYRPHQPYTPLFEYWNRFDRSKWGKGRNYNDGIKMPTTLRESAENLPPMLANLRKNKNGIWCLGKAAEDEQLYRNYISAYYALVEEIDYWIGEIMNALKENGIEDNTIIIYASDHGDFVGNHGMIEKAAMGHNVYEETLRVPLIFYWKDNIISGMQNNDLVGLIDIYPTLVDLLNLKMPELKYPLEGITLVETLKNNKKTNREYIISENWSQASIITKEYKLGLWLDPYPKNKNRDYRSWGNQLYKYREDPNEINNLYISKKYSKVVKNLIEYYNEFCNEFKGIGKEEIKTKGIENAQRIL